MAWILGLALVIAVVALVKALFMLRDHQIGVRTRSYYRAVLAISLIFLAGAAWLGWPGPFGGLGFSRGASPNLPRDELRANDIWLEVAKDAVGPGNRAARPRIQASPEFTSPGEEADTVTMVLRADNAADHETLRDSIRRDTWNIFRSIFEDSRLDWIQEIRIVVTHPIGWTRVDGGEPPVAQVRLHRERFKRLNVSGVNPTRLDDIAEVRWLPPLTTS